MQPAVSWEPDAQREAVPDVAPVQVKLGEGVAPVAYVMHYLCIWRLHIYSAVRQAKF